jgi:arylsulfatase A
MLILSVLEGLAQEKLKKTNFIQILTDDQGWGDLGSYGHDFIQTPHIDKLAEEGVKFTNAYAADAVCSPSRSSILTGPSPYRNGVYTWIPANHFCYLPENEITLPQVLRDNGYQTAHFGKWHLSHYSEKRGETEDDYSDFGFGHPDQPTMDEYGYDYWFATGNVARPNHKDPLNFFLNGKPMGKMEGFSAQIVAAEMVKWFKESRNSEQPFFITLWFHEPHGPINSNPEYIKRYDKVKDTSFQQYLANVTQIDEAVGQIVNELKKEGVYDETLIWYTSDNGPEGPHEYGTFNNDNHVYGGSRYRGSTGGLRGRKRHTHEGGIRVPCIISWPNGFKANGTKTGMVNAEPIIGSDVFPTILDIAGIALPEDRVLDGISILPTISGKKLNREQPLYWRNMFQEFRVAIRDGAWKILSNSERTKFELFNLEIDPRETTDLSEYEPELFEKMKKELIRYDNEVLLEGPKWWDRGNSKKMPKYE